MSIQIMNRICDKGKVFKVLHQLGASLNPGNLDQALMTVIHGPNSTEICLLQIHTIHVNFKPSDSEVQLTDSSIQEHGKNLPT